MKILLDTHILLWAVSGDDKLPDAARKMIEAEKNELFFSLVSLWETEIKHILHPNLMTIGGRELAEYCIESGYRELAFRKEHIYGLRNLSRKPDAAPHKDPFDKILICQAAEENMVFLTHDQLLAGYDEHRIHVV